MAKPTKSSAKSVAEEARARLQLCMDADGGNRAAALDDLKFAAGDQWPVEIKMQRQLDRRPCLTINKTDTFVRSVVNNMRQQRPRIKVHPVGDGADQPMAEVIQGLIRHIEVSSNADAAYDTAADSQVRMGWGYWRILAKYTDETAWTQDLYIERIRNAFSVFFDPSSIQPDGSDAMWCLIVAPMKKDEFKAKYPGKALSDFKSSTDDLTGYAKNDEIMVAEYYRIDEKPETLYRLSNGQSVFQSDLPDEMTLQAHGVMVINKRESMKRVVKWSKLSGADELESQDLAGKYIPVVPVYGAELLDNGKTIRYGMVRNLKDPQKMYNFWRPLSLDTPIPTPDGWRAMRDLHAGDQVFDEHGNACDVIGESPIHIGRKCYRIEFDNGTSVVSDGEHPWTIEQRGKRKTKTYDWTKRDVCTRELVPGKHFVAVPKPLQLPDAPLPIDPYLLGVWLGDGSADEPNITQSSKDIEELKQHIRERGLMVGDNIGNGSRALRFTVFGQRAKFVKAGLLHNKHIPSEYLRASESQRWALLQGLMDTDGSIGKTGLCSFTNTNKAIADGFAELVRSLGIKAAVCVRTGRVRMWANGNVSEHADAWQFSFSAHDDQPVFKLKRKAFCLPPASTRNDRRTKRFGIRQVVEVPSVPVKCIAVNTPTHLFLCGEGMIPTHNTQETEFVALAPKAPWLMAEGQDEGHEDEWDNANVKNYSSLKYKPILDETGQALLPPPQRQQPQAVPAASVNAAMAASEDLKAVAGMFDPALGAQGNETSGSMVQRRQAQSDLSNFHFFDNLTRSMRWTGLILLDLIPYYYDTERIIRIIGEDGNPKATTINQQVANKVANDLTVGRYDVVMDTGPGYDTKRQEGAEMMVNLLRTIPEVGKIAGDLIVRQMDWPGANDLADRLAMANPLAQIDKEIPEGIDPEVKQMLAQALGQVKTLQQQVQQLTLEKQAKVFGVQEREAAVTEREKFKEAAETHRLHLRELGEHERAELRGHIELQSRSMQDDTSLQETLIDATTNLQIAHKQALQRGVPNANNTTK